MSESAAVSALELGVRLKANREQRRLAVAAVAKEVKMQQANLTSVENGKKRITEANLARLGQYYGLDHEEIEQLQALRSAAERREWYQEYSWLFRDGFQRYLGLEAGATSLSLYQATLVFGMLQTEDYATAVIRSGSPYLLPNEIRPRVEVRIARRERLSGPTPLRLNAIFSEAVLRQEIGGKDVMRRQLEHLVAMAAQPNIEIRVLPFSAGAHPAIGGTFSVMTFESEWLPEMVWQESHTTTLSVDRPHQVREYSVALRETRSMAMSTEDSLEFIREVAKGMA